MGLAGPDAPAAEELVDEAIDGNLEVLWVFGHDLVELFGEKKVRELSEKVPLFIYSGTNENPTVPLAHWVLPSSAYVEKDGTFVNCHGRVQRIGRAFPPLGDSREDWRILLELAARMDRNFDWGGRDSPPSGPVSPPSGPGEIFLRLAEAEAPFAGLSYETIGEHGAEVAPTEPARGAAPS